MKCARNDYYLIYRMSKFCAKNTHKLYTPVYFASGINIHIISRYCIGSMYSIVFMSLCSVHVEVLLNGSRQIHHFLF